MQFQFIIRNVEEIKFQVEIENFCWDLCWWRKLTKEAIFLLIRAKAVTAREKIVWTRIFKPSKISQMRTQAYLQGKLHDKQ